MKKLTVALSLLLALGACSVVPPTQRNDEGDNSVSLRPPVEEAHVSSTEELLRAQKTRVAKARGVQIPGDQEATPWWLLRRDGRR